MGPHLYIIRHGRTPANSENKFAGCSAEPLSGEGRQQIIDLVPEIGKLNLDGIYAGPLLRTIQTAEIIANNSIPVHVAQGLIDIDMPHWDGLTKDEIRANFGSQYPTWLATPELFHVEGCEDLHQVQERAVAEMEKIHAAHPTGNILLVTHLIVARCLILHKTGQPMAMFRKITVENGEIVRL
ncbi:MAG: histidine phosphatase family protein [Desulfobulbaceae bacterium]|jgi:broad specificity phosphatase PhoE|nr:histidine phosphatase family protein [Desulfobulbaceae bacterium]